MKVTSRIASAARGVPAPSLHRRDGVEGSRLASSWKLSLCSETSVEMVRGRAHTHTHIYRCIHKQSCDGEASKFFDTRWESVWILFLWDFGFFYCVNGTVVDTWWCFLTCFNGKFPKSDLFLLHVHLKKSPFKMFGTGWALQIKTWKVIGRTLFHASGDAGRSWSSSKWIWGNLASQLPCNFIL